MSFVNLGRRNDVFGDDFRQDLLVENGLDVSLDVMAKDHRSA